MDESCPGPGFDGGGQGWFRASFRLCGGTVREHGSSEPDALLFQSSAYPAVGWIASGEGVEWDELRGLFKSGPLWFHCFDSRPAGPLCSLAPAQRDPQIVDDHRRVVWSSDFALTATVEIERTGEADPIFIVPTNTAPSSTTRPPASTSPKKRAVDRNTTVSLA